MSYSLSNRDVEPKMSQQTDIPELGKCIASRLWYVATVVHRRELTDRCRHRRDVKKLKSLINSCAEQGPEEEKWIAYNLSAQIDNDEEARQKLAHEEFVCTLKLLDTPIPHQSREELLRLFEAVLAAQQKTEVPISRLSQETLECLETNMLQNPALTHWIIDRLLCIWLPSRFAQTDSLLQDVYFGSIRKLLDALSSSNAREVNVRDTPSHGLREERTDNAANVDSGVLLSILSKVNLTEAKEDELLEWLFPALLKTTMNSDDIELALYSRKNQKFFRAWHEFLDDTYLRCRQADSLESALKISRILFGLHENFTASLNVKEMFKRVLQRRTHWVTDILDICFVFLINGRYEEVDKILTIPAFENFWLPLLFKLLKDCPNVPIVPVIEKSVNSTTICGALSFVLERLSTREYNDPTLQRLTRTVEYHVKILNWIVEEKRSCIACGEDDRSPSTISHNFSVKYVLSLFENHSVLAVLKMTTNIHEKPYEDIYALLSDADASRTTFQAYRTVLAALKAILHCDMYNEKYQRVANHFDEMEKLLGSLFPLDLRMQVIEDIFSMLFIRNEDFVELDSASDIGEEDFGAMAQGTSAVTTKKLVAESEIGFVCNKYAIREVLARLRRSLMALELEFADQKRDGALSSEICSSLESGVSRVSEALNDAAWRLELLTSRDFIERHGRPDPPKSRVIDDSPFYDDERLGYSANSKQKTMFYKPSGSSSDENEFIRSDPDGSSETGSQGNTSRRKKRSKNHSSPLTKVSSGISREYSKKRDRTINCMLASKESLVLQCLRKDDYDKATQVIEMFGLKNSRLEGEVLFSRAMNTFRKEMRAQWNNLDSVDSTDGATKESTLQNIRKAVQDGFQTSRTTSKIETFLAAQESSVRLLSSDATSAKELLTLASLDLALTMSRTHQDSINFSDVTMSYMKSCKKFANTRYQAFFENIRQLLYEDRNDLSITNILCDARIPLSVKEAREKNEYWSRLSKKLDAFKRSGLENWESNLDDATNESSLEWCDKNFQDIITMCDNGEVYLARLYAHLKLLRTIVPESCTSLGDNLQLLETSLDTYIGDQIFCLNVELEEIESVASRLGVDLVHSILVNCCPKLPCYPDTRTTVSDTWGFVILNKIEDASPARTFHDPDECVREILSELVKTLRGEMPPDDATLRPEEAKELANKPNIRSVLAKTQRLATLDLCNLSFGHHTLAFFVNVWNLAMIHAVLDVWSKDPPDGDLRNEISLSSVGYDVGDLGTVSLAALRSKLLGQSHLCDTRYFSQTEELNEAAWLDLDVPFDPRVLYAMINEHEDSPIVRVYGPETLDADLTTAMKDYVDYHGNGATSVQRSDGKANFGTEHVRLYDVLVGKRLSSGNEATIDTEDDKVKAGRKLARSFRYSYHVNFSYRKEFSRGRDSCETIDNATNEIPWQSRVVKPKFLQYLEGRCWLLSYLVQRIHEESPTILDVNCENIGRTAVLENLLKSPWINDLKYLFDNNETVAGLRQVTATKEMWDAFEKLLANDESVRCLAILKALPESLVFNNIELQRLTDKILAKLATGTSDRRISEIMSYVYQIKDEHILAQVVLEIANDLPVKACRDSLMHVLSHRNKDKLPAHCKTRMNEILCRATVFRKILPYCVKTYTEDDDEAWHSVAYHAEKLHPVRIVKSLIDANQYELCLEWLEYQAVSSEIHYLITQDLLVGLLTSGGSNDFQNSLKLLRALPVKKALNLCKGVLGKLESIEALRFVVGYLRDNTLSDETAKYRRCLLGIDILEQLDVKERRSYVHLIEQPLLILEQLLMNCRLDGLQKIVVAVHEKHHKDDICVELFDETVRFYAKKALDFRVAVHIEAIEKVKDASSSSNASQSGDFVMPVNIPTKEEWIPNDMARECSCCRVVIFSMFNRRHHCRRCGRVVCGACSPQRMRLPNYPNSVPVRVCNDCKRQTLVQLQTAPSTPSSETFDCWRLTVDETHNKTLRDEFSFENAPNISLCLAILNLHSDHEAYSNFLLDRCDEMKFLLRPDSKGRVNPEIDHGLIIKMIRSLLVAAKVKCAELGLNTGLTHCDRFLSHVDLIATLVNSDCSHLIPRMDKDDYLDDHTLRKLRDMLTEKEQWTIALDVSTKAGLDTHGVWAAWGTACLKVGYYERAREKFARCLDRVSREDSDDWVMLSYPGDSYERSKRAAGEIWNVDDDSTRRSTSSSKSQEGLKNRPSKDPPLLTEILQILERTNPNDAYGNQSTNRCTGAQEILNTLSSLKAISQGHYAPVQPWTSTKSTRYQESLYYLLMYGSFHSILEFFVKHGEYEKCLAYILENEVEPELFVSSVFLPCVKNGCMTNLCETMRSKDSSLLVFKKYLLYTCHSLEKKQLLHTLQQLQLFMKDYVRAAMTCIRFYVTDASSYEDLCSRTRLLVEAQKHLESELQLENFGKKRRKSVTSTLSGQNNLTLEMDPIEIDRHVNTISRQMEIAKFLGSREQEGRCVSKFINKLSYMDSEGTTSRTVPTLFGNQQEKTHLAVLAILCGRDVEEGFGIAFRIMQDYNLRPQKIYSLVGHMLALDRKIGSIEQLIKCCRSSGAPNSSAMSDRVLAHCVKLLLDRSRTDSNPSPKDQIDSLIRIITDVELKIESYIESRQLKAAYLLAVKHSRAQDIRKILKEADRLGQLAIKSICTKWLQQTQKSRGDL